MINLSPVLFREKSVNRKLGPVVLEKGTTDRMRPVAMPPFVSSTYLPIAQTCPETCPFKRKMNGKMRACYADAGFTGFTVRRLERLARGKHATELAALEDLAIRNSFGGGPVPEGAPGVPRLLRLHVSGDVVETMGAVFLAGAAADWRARGGGPVFTYTHSHRVIPASAWGDISCLASVETFEDAKIAMKRGYVPAVVTPRHPADGKAYKHKKFRVIPCPAETRGATCSSCGLCAEKRLLDRGAVVAFSPHGTMEKEVRKRIVQLPLFKEAV